MLQGLKLYLGVESAADEQSLDMLKEILSSWDADVPMQDVFLLPFDEGDFTRQTYSELLHKMEQVLEGWLHGSVVPSGADGGASKRHTKRRIRVVLYDWEIWHDWWWTRIKECFPTIAKSRRLRVKYKPRECCRDTISTHISHFLRRAPLAHHSGRNWKDSNALPPMPAAYA